MKLIQAGPRTAKVMLVGEAPTVVEEATGTPFSGGAGQMLSHMLSRAGISMSECFRTNVVHVRAPEGKFEKFYTKAHQLDLAKGLFRLKQDINEIQPNLVIGLGSGPLYLLTGRKGIDKYRGSILPCILRKGQKVICTYSHGFALKVYEAKAVIEMDFAKCAGDMQYPELNYPKREFFLNPPLDVRAAVVYEMLQAEKLSVDIECGQDSNGRWTLTCVGFSDRADRALVIPWGDEMCRFHIRQLCENDIPKICQNGMFDFSFLREMGINIRNFWWDTMFAHHALMAECASGEDEMTKLAGKKKLSVLRKGLGFLTSIYTREPFYKDEGKVSAEGVKDWNEFYGYNAKDAAVTYEIHEVEDKEFNDFGSRPAFEIEMGVAEPLMAASKRGILIDMDLRAELVKEYDEQIDRFQQALDLGAGRPINVKSNPDMLALLYDKLKLPMKLNRKTKNPTADKDAINELAGKYDHPLLKVILRIREYRDFKERYLNAVVGGDNRMRCSFDVTGTKSGRLSSRASLDGSGTNLHTIPVRKKAGARLRQMFIADPGKVLVVRDYKQAETWVVAYLARCRALIELLNDPTRDIHKETAVRIYNEALELITFEKRYLAKRTGHGSNYGLTGVRLSAMIEEDYETTGVRASVREAQMLIDKYFMIYPEIKENFWYQVERDIKHSRTLTTPLGRRRAFYGDMRDQRAQETLLRDAYSFIPQSTVGDLCNIAVRKVYHDIELGRPEWGAEFLLSVHDSIMMQCNIGCELEVAAAMEESMKYPLTIHGETFTIPSDCQIGFNWNKQSKNKETGEIVNPKGLVDSEHWNGASLLQV